MGVAVTDRITRGTDNVSPFALAWEDDLKLSHITVLDTTVRDAIAEWKRIAYMTCYVISTDKVYRLGADVTIAGQVWTEETFGVPDNVVTEDEIFDENGFIQSQLIQNVFLNDSFVVDSEVAMLALSTGTGNFVIRSDSGDVYVKLNNDDPALIDDFALITYPGAVLTVNGDVGNVVITLSSLIASDVSGFNTAVTDSVVITALSASVITLQNDVDSIELILDDKADLVTGTVPLAQLPYLFPNGVSLSGNNVILGGTLVDHISLDGDSSYNFSIENVVELLFSITDSFELNYDDGVNTLGLVLDSTAGLRYLADISPTASEHTLITKQYVDDRIADIGDGNPFADNVAMVSNFTDPTKLIIFSAANISTATTRTFTLQDVNGTLYTTGGVDVSVADGGTGVSTFTATRLLIGNGTSAITTDSLLTFDSTNDALTVGLSTLHTRGTNNTFLGQFSANYTLSGSANTGFGAATLFALTSGSGNTVSGQAAGVAITTGSNNVALGSLALTTDITGSSNTALGAGALQLTTGSQNIGVGTNAGDNITTGSQNLILGYDLNAQSATTNGQLTIQNALFGTNNIATGSTVSSGNIGLYTVTPTARFHLPAGTATVATAPIKLTSGIALTTPEDGALEYHTSHLYFTIGSTRYQLDQQTGNIGGTTGATDNALIRADGIFGSTVQSSTATLTDGGTLTLPVVSISSAINLPSSGFLDNTRLSFSASAESRINGLDGNAASYSLRLRAGDITNGSGTAADVILIGGSGTGGAVNVVGGNAYISGGTPLGTGTPGNVGLFTTSGSFGSGAKVLFISNATTSATSSPTDGIILHAKDSSDGSTNSTLALYLEQAVEVIGVFVASHKIKIWLNNVEYWIQLDAV